MFKRIPGTTEYRINLKGEIIDLSGSTLQLKKDRLEYVEIELFKEKRKVTLKWLSLLAWFECALINDLSSHLDKVRFHISHRDLKIRAGHVMQFTEPLYFRDGFRYIPSFPQYAIDINGTVIDTLANEVVKTQYEQHGYISLYIYNPDRGVNKYIRTHRLVALAWLPNNDFLNRPIINHINGIRNDNSLSNLEWCSHLENNVHAVEAGLRKDNQMMKVRDVVTKEISIYRSAADLCRKLGLSRGWSAISFTDRLPGFLHKNRYEVKSLSDDSPWYYEKMDYNPRAPKKQHYTITVINKKDGCISIYGNTRVFRDKYRIRTKSDNIDFYIARFKEMYPDHEVSYKRNVLCGPYRVFNRLTKDLKIIKSLKEASEYINIGENTLNLDLRRGYKFIYNSEWVVATGSGDIKIEEYSEKKKPYVGIKIVNELDGSERIASSISHAKSLTGLMEKTIKLRLKDGLVKKGLSFRPLG